MVVVVAGGRDLGLSLHEGETERGKEIETGTDIHEGVPGKGQLVVTWSLPLLTGHFLYM